MRLAGLIVCAAALPLCAQTVVTGTMQDVEGNNLSGSCVARPLQSFASAGGARVTKNMAPIVVSGGLFSATFVPGDSAVGGPVDYSMVCSLKNSRGVPESITYLLRIPTSASAVDLNSAIVSTPAGSSYTVLLPQIAQGSATVGQCLVWSGTTWGPGACGSGGGGGASQSWAQLTSSAWAAMTAQTWNGVTQ